MGKEHEKSMRKEKQARGDVIEFTYIQNELPSDNKLFSKLLQNRFRFSNQKVLERVHLLL